MHPKDFADPARALVASMTLDERASLLSGSTFWDLQPVDRVGLESIMVADGPHGLRTQDTSADHLGLSASLPATCFPTAVNLASSWDTTLLQRVGEAIAVEALAQGVSVVLGPGVNIKRSPLCGRNFEYFSEDPFLTGHLAAAFITGLQSKGVGASIKHFAANNQENGRMVIDTLVDERTLREIYFPGFEIAIRAAQPWTVMHAYNRLNGAFCSEHDWLLTEVLRAQWGFEGLVVSDWGATNDRVAGVRAGADLQMPSSGGSHDAQAAAAVTEGRLEAAALDRCAERVVALMLAGQHGRSDTAAIDFEAHDTIAEDAATQGAVLLKNDRSLLPLQPGQRLAVIGGFAEQPRYQGAGSSQVNAARMTTPLSALREAVEAAGGSLHYARGYDPVTADDDPALIAEAVDLAAKADAVLILAGLPPVFESEGYDRDALELPPQIDALIAAVAQAQPDCAVVLSNGSPVRMPWLEGVASVLELYLAGQAGAGALRRLVFGQDCPSGKLAETFPLALSDSPAQANFDNHPRQVIYREGLNVGYRYFTSHAEPVLFPFGHGLSYTSFAYGEASLSAPAPDLSEPVVVSLPITNTGAVAGAEIVQVYVRQHQASVYRPDRELKGFTKLHLNPGETGEARIALDQRAFAFWDQETQAWRVEPTDFEILIGASSEDIRARLDFKPATATASRPAFQGPATVIQSDAELAAAGLRLTPTESLRPFHSNSTMADIRHNWLGKRVYAQAEAQMQAFFAGDDSPVVERMRQSFLENLPLRTLQSMSQGKLSAKRLDMMIALMNGHWLKALRGLF